MISLINYLINVALLQFQQTTPKRSRQEVAITPVTRLGAVVTVAGAKIMG